MTNATTKNVAETNFYFVCGECNAKWFAPVARARCPRCDKRALSGERQTPPWQRPPVHPEKTA